MPSSKTKKKKNAKKKEVDEEQVATLKKAHTQERKRDVKRVLKPLSKGSAYMRKRRKRIREGEDYPARAAVGAWEAMLVAFSGLEEEVRNESARNTISRQLLNKFNTMFAAGREILQVLKDKEKDEEEHFAVMTDIEETMAKTVRDLRNTMGLRLMNVPYIQPSTQPLSTLVSNLTDEFDRTGSRRGIERRKEQERLKEVLQGEE